MFKRIISILLAVTMLFSLCFNITFSAESGKSKRAVYLHADVHNPSETRNMSEVEKGSVFNLYFAIDNPNKGKYNSAPAAEVDGLSDAVKLAEEMAIADTNKDAEAYVDLLGITEPDARDLAIKEYLDNHLDANISIAKTRAEQIVRHEEAHYDLNGYSLKIYYDGNFFEYVKNPASKAQGVIDYTIPGSISQGEIGSESVNGSVIDNVPTTVGYHVRFSGSGVDDKTGLNYAYLHVYFAGTFLPQEKEPTSNWYDLCAIPLKAKTTGTSTVFLGSGTEDGVKLYAKHTDSADFSPLFSVTAENGGYHTINIVNQKKPNPPTASPDYNVTYTKPQEVTLSCSTPDCDIFYSKNGGEFVKYQEPFTVTSTTEIVAYSQKKSDTTAVSNYATFKYRIVPEKPLLYEEVNGSMQLIPDVYNKDTQFVVYADNKIPYDSSAFQSDVTIYYTYSDIYPENFTSGGTDPYSEWVPLVKGAGNPINVDKAETVRLIARIENGGTPETSEVAVYKLGVKPAPVTATPDSSELTAPQTIILETATNGAEILYTLDGSDPRTDGIRYNNSGVYINNTTTIRAVAVKDGIASDVSEFRYEYDNPSASFISADLPSGEYEGNIQVNLISSVSGETIRYRFDETSPWEIYEEPITVTKDTKIYAKTQTGEIYTFTYSIIPSPPVFSPAETIFATTEKVTVYAPDTTPENTADYELYYSFGDTDPKTSGIKADDKTDTKVFDISEKTTINAVVKQGDKWSETVSQTYDVYTKRPAPPVATLPSGEYTIAINGDSPETGFFTPAEDIEIYYTISPADGVNPDPAPGTLYTPGDKLPLSGAVTINAIAVNKNTNLISEVAVFNYTVIPETPKAAIDEGETSSTIIPVDCVEGSKLIYTAGNITNEIPNVPSRVYIDIRTGNAYDNPECTGTPLGNENTTPNSSDEITLKIQSELSGITSGTNIYDYTITSSLSAPYADKPSGTYPETDSDGENNYLTVTLKSDNTASCDIYYKTDAGVWKKYTEPIKLKEDTILYTKTSDGTTDSEVNTYIYEFVPPAPVFSKESGEYLSGTVITVSLPENLPDDKYYQIMLRSSKDPEGTEDIPIANNTEFILDSSVSYKAYIISEDGKRSENTIKSYRVSDSYIITGKIYTRDPYKVDDGKVKYISKHMLSKELYNEGIRLATMTSDANINYTYTVYRSNTPPATSDIGIYSDTLPIPVSPSMNSIVINAWLTDKNNVDINDSECTFIYKFVDLEVPETDLYRSDASRIEYPANTEFVFVNDYPGDPLYSLYYTTDSSAEEITVNNSKKYTEGEKLKVASNLTVKASYRKACGESICSSCLIGDYDNCPNSVFGDIGTYKYTVPTVQHSGGGGGGGSSSTSKYTSDIFGNIEPTHIGYIKGYPDGSVRPDAGITREEIAAIIYRIKKFEYDTPFETTGEVFPDVNKKRWSVTEIEFLANDGVILGYPDGSYQPTKKLTRAEFCALITRFIDKKTNLKKLPFDDVSENHWSYEYVSNLYSNNLLQGYEDNTFRPDNNISRAEVMTVINKILGRNPSPSYLKALGYNPFNDLEKTDWYYSTVLEATITHNYVLKSNIEIKWEDIR